MSESDREIGKRTAFFQSLISLKCFFLEGCAGGKGGESTVDDSVLFRSTKGDF